MLLDVSFCPQPMEGPFGSFRHASISTCFFLCSVDQFLSGKCNWTYSPIPMLQLWWQRGAPEYPLSVKSILSSAFLSSLSMLLCFILSFKGTVISAIMMMLSVTFDVGVCFPGCQYCLTLVHSPESLEDRASSLRCRLLSFSHLHTLRNFSLGSCTDS